MNYYQSIILFIFFYSIGGVSAFASSTSRTITIALSQAPTTLDPRLATDATGMRITNLLFQSLVRLDRNLNIKPSLATHWSYQDHTYTFFIPQGVRFSNGRYMTKEDIQFSFEQYQSPKNPFYSAFKIIQKVDIQKTPEGFTVVLKMKQNSPTFLKADLPILKILPKKEIELSDDSFHKQPIGTGAFQLSHQTDNAIHLGLNPFYQKPPFVKKVIFSIIRDDLTRYQKMLRKEIDILQSELSYLKMDHLKKSKLPYRFFQKEGLSVNYLLFNLKDALFKNKEIRRAVALGIHREEIVKYQFNNYVTIAHSILNANNPFFYMPSTPRTFNLEKAKQIIQQNQWGQKKVILTTSNNREVIAYGRILAHQLRQIGLKVELKSYEWGTFYGDLKRGQFQMALLRWVGAFDPDIYRLAFHRSQVPPKGRNRGFYINPQLDSLLDTGRAETTIAKRKAIYKEVQQIIYRDIPIVHLWHNTQLSLVKNHIIGYFLPMDGSYSYLHTIQTTESVKK